MIIGFAGMTHLGIHYSFASAAKGFTTLCYDASSKLAGELTQGHLPVSEPGLQELFESNRQRLEFTSDLEKLSACEVVFVAPDVPTNEENQSDLRPVEKLIRAVATQLKTGATLVILSQLRPGFTRTLLAQLRSEGHLKTESLFYQVETLIFGRAVERAMKPERYIIGGEHPEKPLPPLYDKWLKAFECPLLVMRYESAELAKISINFFLVSSVATTNTIAELCEQIGADWNEIAPSLKLDRRIGPYAYLKPGLGISGGNLERDLITLKTLAEKHQTDKAIVEAWLHNSTHQKSWASRVLKTALLNQKPDAKIALWGIAYKEDTHSIKNSPAIEFLRSIKSHICKAYDPVAKLPPDLASHVEQVPTAEEACAGADVLCILTPWGEFRQKDWALCLKSMKGKLLLDPFGLIPHEVANEQGFKKFTLGTS